MKCEQQLNERCSNKILHVRYKPQDWHVTDLSREKTLMREILPWYGATTFDWKKRVDWTRCRGCSITNENVFLDLHAWMPSEVLK